MKMNTRSQWPANSALWSPGRTMTHQTDAFCCAHQTCTGTRTTVLRSKTSSASRRGATTTTTALSQYLRPRGKRNRIKVTSLPTTPSAVSSTTNASSPASTTPPPTFNPTTSVEPSVEPSGHGTDEDMEMEPEDSDNEPVDGTQSENEADYQPAEGDVTTAFPRSRAHQYTKHAERDRNNDSPEVPAEFPWTWARNIMLEKPVQKKSAQL